MRSFVYRAASLGLRFACPLFILAISTPALMGKYYLFAAYFTFVVFLIALELAIPFSRKYLRQRRQAGQRKVFTAFMLSQFGLSLVLAVPATAVYFLGAPGSPCLILLFALAVVSEACINELGRFFWNIGRADTVSRRDFLRSIIFVGAMAMSVAIDREIVSAISLGTIIVCNMSLLAREMHVWGSEEGLLRMLLHTRFIHVRRIARRLLPAIGEALPQVLHMQIMALQPLLERTVIENRAGIEMVAPYSFQYSVVQSGASLFLVPLVATTRRAILSANSPAEWAEAHSISLWLLPKVLLLASLLAVGAHFAVPIAADALGKELSSNVIVLLAALLASVAASYAAAISPLYARTGRLWRANSAALLSMLPLMLLSIPDLASTQNQQLIVMLAIMATAAAQIIVRFDYVAGSRKPTA